MVTIDIQPIGLVSAIENSPFDQALQSLEKEDFGIISLPGNALLRRVQGKDHSISKKGNYTREEFLYIPQENYVYLVKESSILEDAVKATQDHREEKEYFITKEQQEKALIHSVKIPYTIKSIPTNRFAKDEIIKFSFEQEAEPYGEFLQNNGIKTTPIYLVDQGYVNKKDKPFVR